MRHLALLLALSLSTTACSKLNSSRGGGDLNQAPVSAKGLDGEWAQSACQSDPVWGQEVTSTSTFAQGLEIAQIKVWIPGSNCTQLEYVADLTFAYDLHASTTVNAAFDIDLTLLSAQITPQSQAAADSLNNLALKGIQTWSNGKPQSFTDFSTGDWQVTLYDVIVIQPTYLFWGDLSSGDGTSAETRPTAVDSANFQLRL